VISQNAPLQGIPLTRTALVSIFLAGCHVSGSAFAQPPQDVIESCLLGYATAPGLVVATGEIGHQMMEDVPGYRLTWPERLPGIRVGYAVGKAGKNDYVFAGRYRGYIHRAIPLTQWKPERLATPLIARYGVVELAGRRYACVTEANGQGSAAFVVAGYIGRFPPGKGQAMQLYYVVADTKTFKSFRSD